MKKVIIGSLMVLLAITVLVGCGGGGGGAPATIDGVITSIDPDKGIITVDPGADPEQVILITEDTVITVDERECGIFEAEQLVNQWDVIPVTVTCGETGPNNEIIADCIDIAGR